MPKGVEHTDSPTSRSGLVFVPLAVMPKGVEHPVDALEQLWAARVPLAVMPKGVEHCGAPIGSAF